MSQPFSFLFGAIQALFFIQSQYRTVVKLTPVLWLSYLAHAREKTKLSGFKSNNSCLSGWYLIKSCHIDYTYLPIGVYRMPIRLCSIMSRFKKKQMTLPHRRITTKFISHKYLINSEESCVFFTFGQFSPFCFWDRFFHTFKYKIRIPIYIRVHT